MYKTRMTFGGDSYSVSSTLVPLDPASKLQIYCYVPFENAVELGCSPSYAIDTGVFAPNVASVVRKISLTLSSQLEEG